LSVRNCLPSPAPGTPLHEILAFRSENQKPLSRLRNCINKLHLSIYKEGDEDTLDVVKEDIKSSVDDVHEIYKKSGFKFFRNDAEISIRIPNELIVHAAGFLADWVTAMAMPVFSALSSAISAKLISSKAHRPGNAFPSDYQYVLKGLRENIIRDVPGIKEPTYDINNVQLENNLIGLLYPSHIVAPTPMSMGAFRNNTFL